MEQEQKSEPNRYLDRIPDDILHLILNKVLDANTLVRCLTLSKRFATIIPQTDAVSLPLFLPPRPRPSGSLVNILKSLVNFVITKPLHLLGHRRRRDSLPESPCQCPPQLLRTFHRIADLRFELHNYGGIVDAQFLKWKATYGSQLKTCVVLCATSLHRGVSSRSARDQEREEEHEEETTSSSSSSSSPALPNEEFKSRIMWTISCLIAASARHFLLKQMLAQFTTLKTIVITDANKQGRFSMEEEELRDLRDSLKRGGPAMLSPDAVVVPDLRMRMWYVPDLELPAVGCAMKGATLVVIGPAGEMVPAAERSDGGFDGDEAEKAVFAEAEREIVKKKKKSSYVMEMTSF